MADLTAQATGGAGLGSRPTRWGIVTVWALNLIHGLMAGVLGPGRRLTCGRRSRPGSSARCC